MASEFQNIRNKIAVRIRGKVFNGKDAILVIDFFDCIQASLQIAAYARRCRHLALYRTYEWSRPCCIRMGIVLSLNDATRPESTIKTYAEVVNLLLRLSATDTVSARGNREFRWQRVNSPKSHETWSFDVVASKAIKRFEESFSRVTTSVSKEIRNIDARITEKERSESCSASLVRSRSTKRKSEIRREGWSVERSCASKY